MEAITYSVFRQSLASVLDKVNDDSVPVQITRKGNKGAIVMSIEDYDQLTETLYVLQNKSLSAQIEQSIKTHEARTGHQASQHTLNEITSL
ncbi:MAG: type II toxin-antitoxin system Phd/YefM family antitoxin [Methylophaga sp.]|nr:type II toxin-antitoxin system Phd/YefM family antitoxin [Methylophaga sp.]